MKFLLLTPYTGGNLGDAAIQEAVIANIRKRIPDAQIVLVTLSPEDTTRLHGMRSFPIDIRTFGPGFPADEDAATPSEPVGHARQKRPLTLTRVGNALRARAAFHLRTRRPGTHRLSADALAGSRNNCIQVRYHSRTALSHRTGPDDEYPRSGHAKPVRCRCSRIQRRYAPDTRPWVSIIAPTEYKGALTSSSKRFVPAAHFAGSTTVRLRAGVVRHFRWKLRKR